MPVRPVFVVAILLLPIDEEAQAFFRPDNKTWETLGQGRPYFQVASKLTDVFTEKGRERFPALQRSDLSCLWVEDQNRGFMTVPLRDLNQRQIAEVIADLGDAIDHARNILDVKIQFDQRQAARKQSALTHPEDTSMKPAPEPHPGNSQPKPGGPGNDQKESNLQKDSAGGGGGNDLSGLATLWKIGGPVAGAAGLLWLFLSKIAFQQAGEGTTRLIIVVLFGVCVIFSILAAATSITKTARLTQIMIAIVGLAVAALSLWAIGGRPASTNGYQVRVTVLNPSGTPADNAHVWSTVGGETKQVQGGWEIEVPPPAKGSIKIFAEVPDQGWRGSTDLTLAGDHSPRVQLELKSSGELPVSGTVFGSDGRTVANAMVSISGSKAVASGANGEYELATHARAGEKVNVHAEKSPEGVADLFDFTVGSGAANLTLNSARKRSASSPPALKVEKTGDKKIDQVLVNLAALKQSSTAPSEAQWMATLAPLFDRPAFYGIREEDWQYFLYVLCRTRLLIEEYKSQFKAHPQTRAGMDAAIEKMVQLQNDVAGLYGPNFSLTQHISRYIHSEEEFVRNLPPVVTNPSPAFFDARDRQIHAIVDDLKTAGLPIDRAQPMPASGAIR